MLTLAESVAIVEAVIRAAADEGRAVSVAVVDPGGHLLTFYRMDGATFATVDVAVGKAWTAAGWVESTRSQREKAESLPLFAAAMSVSSAGRYVPQTGGVPIMGGDTLLGAVGASGRDSTGDDDERLVAAAVESSASHRAG